MHCAHTQVGLGLGSGLRRRHRQRRHQQWAEATALARAVGAQARGSDCCAHLVAIASLGLERQWEPGQGHARSG